MDKLIQPPGADGSQRANIPITSQPAGGPALAPRPLDFAQPPARPRLFSRTALWAICILAAFAATHTPPPAKPTSVVINDKLLHFVGFGIIGLLTVWRLAESKRRTGFGSIARWYLCLLLYGLFDEATQELVGRSFEWSDWLADAAGAATGMVIGIACRLGVPKKVTSPAFLFFTTALFCACDKPPVKGPDREQFVRVLFVASAKDDPTWPIVTATARRFVERYPLIAIDVEAPATSSPKAQQELLSTARERQAQVVCVMPSDPAALRGVVSGLSTSGIPVVAVGKDIPDSHRDSYCGPSEHELGAKCAEACGRILEKRSKTVMLLHAGDADPAYGARLRGFRDACPRWGGLEILREVDGSHDAQTSLRLVKADAKRYPRIGCWVFMDDWPLRAIDSKERMFPLGVTIVLCNADPAHWDRLRDGQIQAMVGYDLHAVIEESFFKAMRLVRADLSNISKDSFVPAEIITDKSLPEWEARWSAWQNGQPSPKLRD